MKRGSFQIKALNRGLCFLATDNFLLKISAIVIRHTNRETRSRTFLLVVTHKNFSTLLVRPFLLKWYPNSLSSLPSEQQTKSPDVFTSGSLFVVLEGTSVTNNFEDKIFLTTTRCRRATCSVFRVSTQAKQLACSSST